MAGFDRLVQQPGGAELVGDGQHARAVTGVRDRLALRLFGSGGTGTVSRTPAAARPHPLPGANPRRRWPRPTPCRRRPGCAAEELPRRPLTEPGLILVIDGDGSLIPVSFTAVEGEAGGWCG